VGRGAGLFRKEGLIIGREASVNGETRCNEKTKSRRKNQLMGREKRGEQSVNQNQMFKKEETIT